METNGAAGSGNRYCRRLGVPLPDLEGALAGHDVKLSHLMALALLEAGGPMSVEAIAERLKRLDLPRRLARAADPAALLKAWHGQGPLVRDPVDGLFYLDLLSHREVGYIAAIANPVRHAAARRVPEEFRQALDTEPVTQEEVDAAFKRRMLFTYSSVRQAAAILEAAGGGPLPLEEANGRLKALTGWSGIDERNVAAWRSDLVRSDADGLLHLNTASADAPKMRRDVRKMALATLRQRAQVAGTRENVAEREAERAEEVRVWMDEARRTRRALVQVVTVDGVPRAAAVVDAAGRQLRLFIGDGIRDLPAHLERFDFLAGLDVRPSLRALGLEPDRWWLAELRPSQRTFRPSEGGRALAVSLPSIVLATTGRRGVPADPKEWKRLLNARSAGRLEARLAREAEALFALYQYGAFHGGVRMRRREGDSLLPVTWWMRGDPDFSSLMKASVSHLSPIELVVGPPPGLADDPWHGAISVAIVEREPGRLYVRDGEHLRVLDPADVCAAGLPDPEAAAAVTPAHDFSWDRRRCRLKVTLEGIEPPIWRLIEVGAAETLSKLHELLQAAFGWTNSHLHVFKIGEERIAVPYELEELTEGHITRSSRIVTLGHIIDRGFTRFAYEYDFGDGWRHTIEVEEVRPGRDEDDEGLRTRCLDGARACPPEDCGGPDGYERLLEILFDPRHPEFEDMRRWAGGFEPERFDARAASEAMARVPWF